MKTMHHDTMPIQKNFIAVMNITRHRFKRTCTHALLLCVYMSFYVCALVPWVKMKSFLDL